MRLAGLTLNTYYAMLAVTVVASGAALLIVHIATADTSRAALGNEAQFQDLQRSILGR
jgi:hypothetical protein